MVKNILPKGISQSKHINLAMQFRANREKISKHHIPDVCAGLMRCGKQRSLAMCVQKKGNLLYLGVAPGCPFSNTVSGTAPEKKYPPSAQDTAKEGKRESERE